MIAGGSWIMRAGIPAACLMGAAGFSAPVVAAGVDFESPLYVHDKTIDQVDGWSRSSLQGGLPENFRTFAEGTAQAGNKWMRVWTNGYNTLFRGDPSFPANTGYLDVQWRWRLADIRANVCLGVSAANDNARAATRALTCFHPQGTISVVEILRDKEINAEGTWVPNTVYHMRMRLDHAKNIYSVYMGTDSLRADEKLIASGVTMAGLVTAPFARIVVRSEDGIGTADVDDILWEPVAYWKGNDADSLASNPRNWSTGLLPDTSTQIVFNSAAARGCLFDKALAVKSVTVEKGYPYSLNLGAAAVTATGKLDLTGLKSFAAANGGFRLSAPRAQAVTGPEAGGMPGVLHDGAGLLRLDGRALFTRAYWQTAGSLDLNGFDLVVEGQLLIQNGGPASLRNLSGRNITVGRSARFEGTAGSPLALLGPAKAWTLSVTDTLAVRYAEIQNSTASKAAGYAVNSTDKGGNSGWTFLTGPVILVQPKPQSINVGQIATLKVSATGSGLPMTFQWLKGDAPVAGQKDSIFTRTGASLADNGNYSCVVATGAGSVTSTAALLTVAFPAPTALPGTSAFTDSVQVKLATTVAGAKLLASRNGQPYAALAGDLLVIRESTHLKAVAVLGSDTSAAGAWDYTLSTADQVAEPIISPEPIDFRDSLVVTMTAVTPGSDIHYTLDGSVPDAGKAKYTGPITLRASTVVKAIGVKAGMLNSTIHEHSYLRITSNVGLPTANPPGGSFGDSVIVTLAAPANSPSAALWYRLNGGNLLMYQGPILLKESTELKAIAIQGAVIGDTATWIFTRRLEAPAASPKGRKFPDTLRVGLSPRISGAQVRYTLDGSAPTAASPLYASPFLLDSTAILKAVSLKDGMAMSEALTEVYELVPDSLFANPRGGDFPSGIAIALRVTSLKAQVWYTLDGSTPGPENPLSLRYVDGIRLDTNAVLKAVAVAGQGATLRRGQVITESYTFIAVGVRTLGPGQTLDLSPRYSLSNPFPGAPSVQVEVAGAEGLGALPGFRDVQFGMHVTLPSETSAFPEVRFMAPAGEERSLYGLSPGGQVQFISHADTVALPGTGTYFLGIDTAAPAILVSGESFAGLSDSTRIVFTIKDNVSGLLLDLQRSDAPSLNFAARPISNQEILTVTLKAPAAWAPLWIKLRVDDRRNLSHFPADPAREYLLAQRSASPLRTPAEFRIGSRADQPWDMVSIPLELAGRITLGMLKEHNTVKGLSARVHDPVSGKTRALPDNESLEPGKAIWMGSPASISSLTLPPFQTGARHGNMVYTVRLGKGWTQIANPSLKPLIWPFSRSGFDYLSSQVKGLHGFDPALPGSGYFHADTLKPWKGYFVLNTSGKDTVIILRASPVPAGSPPARILKRGAPDHLALRMGLDRLPVLRLGALPQAADGLGVEDEPQPPAPGERGGGLWSARGRARLGTDYLRFTPGALHAWTVVAGGDLTGAAPASPETRIEALDLPEGYAAWAVSRSRGLKFPLSRGARIPLVPGAADSLDVYAGPASAVEARLAGIPVRVEDFRLAALPRRGGYTLSLGLPHAATLSFDLAAVDGKVEDRGRLALAAGYYDLARAGRGGRPLAAGIYLLRIDWKGDGKTGRLVRKLALP